MDNNNTFYQHVSSWIASYQNPDSIHFLRRFVSNSNESREIKEQLFKLIDIKYAQLRGIPAFSKYKGELYLVDSTGHPRIYTTRFAAICKVAELKLIGYDVELDPGEVFYRIKVKDVTPSHIGEAELN